MRQARPMACSSSAGFSAGSCGQQGRVGGQGGGHCRRCASLQHQLHAQAARRRRPRAWLGSSRSQGRAGGPLRAHHEEDVAGGGEVDAHAARPHRQQEDCRVGWVQGRGSAPGDSRGGSRLRGSQAAERHALRNPCARSPLPARTRTRGGRVLTGGAWDGSGGWHVSGLAERQVQGQVHTCHTKPEHCPPCPPTPNQPPTLTPWKALMALARCLRGMEPEMKRYPNPAAVRRSLSHSIVDTNCEKLLGRWSRG